VNLKFQMEQVLEAIILGGGDHQDVENAILHIILNRGIGQHPNLRFNLNEISNEEAKGNFRFEKQDIPILARLLEIPNLIRTESRNVVEGETALAILLRRLAYPNRWQDLRTLFHLSSQSLSQIASHTANIILANKGALLENLNNLQWLNHNRLRQYAAAIHEKGAAVPNCWGFIDGTARQICRPSVDQDQYYSGHKRCHCVKYQSVLCPDGLIVNLKGAWPGRRHDAGMFRESNLYQELVEVARFQHESYVLYGDAAYGIRELLLGPYTGGNLLQIQRNFNNSMKVLRIAVEWGFQKVASQFAFVDFKKNQKLLLQEVETMYKIAVLLTNCHTCLYGSETSQYFDIVPPPLEVYLG
jgi:hypothetical protein